MRTKGIIPSHIVTMVCIYWRVAAVLHLQRRFCPIKGSLYIQRSQVIEPHCRSAVRHRHGPAFSLGRSPRPHTRTLDPAAMMFLMGGGAPAA